MDVPHNDVLPAIQQVTFSGVCKDKPVLTSQLNISNASLQSNADSKPSKKKHELTSEFDSFNYKPQSTIKHGCLSDVLHNKPQSRTEHDPLNLNNGEDNSLEWIYRQHLKHIQPVFTASQYLLKNVHSSPSHCQAIKLMFDVYSRQVARAQKVMTGATMPWGPAVTTGPHMPGCLVATHDMMESDDVEDLGRTRVLRKKLGKLKLEWDITGGSKRAVTSDSLRTCSQKFDNKDSEKLCTKKLKVDDGVSIVRNYWQSELDEEDEISVAQSAMNDECEADDDFAGTRMTLNKRTMGRQLTQLRKNKWSFFESGEKEPHSKCTVSVSSLRKNRQKRAKNKHKSGKHEDVLEECDLVTKKGFLTSKKDRVSSSYHKEISSMKHRNDRFETLGSDEELSIGAQIDIQEQDKRHSRNDDSRRQAVWAVADESSNEATVSVYDIRTHSNRGSTDKCDPVISCSNSGSTDKCDPIISCSNSGSTDKCDPIISCSQSSESLLDANGNLYSTQIGCLPSGISLQNRENKYKMLSCKKIYSKREPDTDSMSLNGKNAGPDEIIDIDSCDETKSNVSNKVVCDSLTQARTNDPDKKRTFAELTRSEFTEGDSQKPDKRCKLARKSRKKGVQFVNNDQTKEKWVGHYEDIPEVMLSSQCPICDNRFHASLIEQHASTCGEEPNQEDIAICDNCKLHVPVSLIPDHRTVCLKDHIPGKRVTRSKKTNPYT